MIGCVTISTAAAMAAMRTSKSKSCLSSTQVLLRFWLTSRNSIAAHSMRRCRIRLIRWIRIGSATLGAQVLSIDGKPTEEVVSSNVPWSSPFSTDTAKRLQQLRYALRFPLDKGKVAVGYINPSGGGKQTSTLNVVNEFDSFSATSFYAGQSATELPVEFKILPDGMGYIKLDTFSDNEVLMIQLWERAISIAQRQQGPGPDHRHAAEPRR